MKTYYVPVRRYLTETACIEVEAESIPSARDAAYAVIQQHGFPASADTSHEEIELAEEDEVEAEENT